MNDDTITDETPKLTDQTEIINQVSITPSLKKQSEKNSKISQPIAGLNRKNDKNIVFKCTGAIRKQINTFVNTKFFVRGILAAILINTLSMGVEHHNQPELLTQIVEYSNFVFTIVFFLEMILKVIGDGLFNYIKNAFNIFDGAIVGLRQAS